MNFKLFYESKNKTLLSVDIQPEYYYKASKYGGFRDDLLSSFIMELNSNKYNNKIILYNGENLSMISENDYKVWLLENGLDEEVLDSLIFYDKGYAFFRYCMDSSIDEDDIVLLVKFMMSNDIRDSRELKTSELWDKFMSEYNKIELRELLEDADDCINIPDLIDWLGGRIGNSEITLIGGGANECLKEVEIALKAMGVVYKKNDKLIYESPKH